MKTYKNLQKARIKNRITQKALGKKVGASKQYIWDIEDGRKTLSYKMAFKMSKVLNEKPDELFLEDYKRKHNHK